MSPNIVLMTSKKIQVSGMTEPLVSCILPTRNRKLFLQQAIRYFLRQTYTNRELIIVDDSEQSNAALVPSSNQIRYLRLKKYTPVGTKMNIGIIQSRGQIIQKLDDDDYYHHNFLRRNVCALLNLGNPHQSVVGFECFLVLIATTGELKFSGHGWFAGGTFCFYKELWRQQPFRNFPASIDWYFLQDHQPQRIKMSEPELYILVRHESGHTWNQLRGVNVTDYFCHQPNYSKSLTSCLNFQEDLMFYETLKQRH